MSNLWVVIPAAGESRRFKEAGYETTKALLAIKDKKGVQMRMVIHVVSSLPSRILKNQIVVGLPCNIHPGSPFFNYINIDKTIGQADTIYQLIRDLPQDDSVLILDCDMIVKPIDIKEMLFLLEIYDAVIAVAKTFDPNSSRVNKIPFPTRFVEKQPISEWGIVGARAFNNIGRLTSALKTVVDMSVHTTSEPYLSHAINYYPGTKYANVITEYIDWGTPERIKESGAEIVDS